MVIRNDDSQRFCARRGQRCPPLRCCRASIPRKRNRTAASRWLAVDVSFTHLHVKDDASCRSIIIPHLEKLEKAAIAFKLPQRSADDTGMEKESSQLFEPVCSASAS